MVAIPQKTWRFWLLVLAGLIGLLWLFRPVMGPFVTGLVVAYFLEPLVEILEKRKWPRWAGASMVLGGFVLSAALLIVLLWPLVSSQIGALLDTIPDYADKIRTQYLPWAQKWLTRISPADVEKIRGAAAESAGNAAGFVSHAMQSLVSGGIAVIDTIAVSILAPITAFYVLRDWNKLTAAIDRIIPRRYHTAVREQMNIVDETLSGFIRGQAIVCFLLGLFYALGLVATGLEYGATVGLIAGILSIIPYVGTIFGWGTSVILAFVQFADDWASIGAVVGVFVVGHVLESYILTPRFVGDRVGLHPVWILFALIAGAELMGFTGVLIAVPVAAVIGVLVRFALQQYKQSGYYQ